MDDDDLREVMQDVLWARKMWRRGMSLPLGEFTASLNYDDICAYDRILGWRFTFVTCNPYDEQETAALLVAMAITVTLE